MTADEIREKLAREAARLMLRGKESDFAAARKRAARWLKRRRLHRDEIPSNQEIQVQLYALSGLLASERDPQRRAQQRHALHQLLIVLDGLPAIACDQPTPYASAEVAILCHATPSEVRGRLQAAGRRLARSADTPRHPAVAWEGIVEAATEVALVGLIPEQPLPTDAGCWTRAQLEAELLAAPVAEFAPADDEHPDAFDVFQMLLEPLARVVWSSDVHPEGDALYHSLQVFEMGVAARPYDEEFLLACLLHDVGWGINPRHPVLAGLDALGTLVTERTRFLIEQRPVGHQYLQTGSCPKSLRHSEDFEDVLLLARCDRDGRVAGARVRTLEGALEYLAGLETAWDE